MPVIRPRLVIVLLSALPALAAPPGLAAAATGSATTTTTVPACRGLHAACRCTDGAGCTAVFECAEPSVSCEEVRAICVSHCAEHGGPGDCEQLACVDSCTDRPCD